MNTDIYLLLIGLGFLCGVIITVIGYHVEVEWRRPLNRPTARPEPQDGAIVLPMRRKRPQADSGRLKGGL